MTEKTPGHNPYQSPVAQQMDLPPDDLSAPSRMVNAVAISFEVFIFWNLAISGAGVLLLAHSFGAFKPEGFQWGGGMEKGDPFRAMFFGMQIALGGGALLSGASSYLSYASVKGIRRRRKWGRTMALIVSGMSGVLGLMLLSTPAWPIYFGHAIFALAVLLRPKYAREFW